MATAVESASAELQVAKTGLDPIVEGLHDFSAVNLKPDTQTTIQSTIIDYERRQTLIKAAQSALQALMADGYPNLPVRPLRDSAFQDLKDQVSTMTAAFGQFEPEKAQSLNPTASESVPKA